MNNKLSVWPLLLVALAVLAPDGGDNPPHPPLNNGKECYNYRAPMAVFGEDYLPLNQGSIGTCVAVSGKGVCDGENAIAYLTGKRDKPLPVSAESLYGGRVEVAGRQQPRYGDGWYGVGFAKWVTEAGGQIYEKNYPEYGIDLSRGYSVDRARDWGQYGNGGQKDGIGGAFDKEASKNKFAKRARISTLEELDKALENYHFVQTCSGIGFDSPRDKDGFCARRGSWSHAQFFCGKRTKAISGRDGYLVQNSWGAYIRGDGGTSNKYLDQPDGSYYVTPSDALAMLRAGDSWIVTYDEFKKAKDMPWLHAAYAQVPAELIADHKPKPDPISTPLWHKTYPDAYVDAKGDKPLLVFWKASWCGNPCASELKRIEKVLEKYRGHVSAVVLDWDAHSELRREFGVTGYVPQVLLYDEQGRNGIDVTRRADLEKLIDQRLTEPVY